MNAPKSFDPSWIALAVGAIACVLATLSLARPARPLVDATEAWPPPESVVDAFAVRPAASTSSRVPADPFRRARSISAPTAGPSEPAAGLPTSYPIDPPRLVGVGKRIDGVSFVGCQAGGAGPTIVREGQLCGVYRLLDVFGDSARFSLDSSDSILTVGVRGS